MPAILVRATSRGSSPESVARLKLALVLGAAMGTLLVARAARRAPPAAGCSFAVKLTAAGLVILWLVIPLLGRMIAYDRAIWGSLSGRA